MRKFLTIFLVCLIFFLCSCSNKTDNKTHISFSTWGSKTEIETIKTLIREFEQENQDIKIDLIHIPDNYFQKLHLLIASNLSPDVIFLNNLNSRIYIKSGRLENLSPYLKKSKKISENDFIDKALIPLSYNNNLYAIPRDVSNLVIYYNKDLFDKYKVPYPTPNWTQKDFLSIAKQLTLDTNKDNKIDIFGFGFEKQPLFWLPFLLTNNGGILSADENSIILNTNNSKQALQFYSDLRNKYHVAPKIEEQASLTTSQLFLQGKVAMHICGRWCSQTYKKNADFNWDVINFPNINGKSIVNVDTSGWAISSTCKHKQEAWEFIEFLSSDSSSKILTKEGLILPAKKTIANSQVFLNPPPENAKIFIEIIKNSKATPICTKYAEITDLLNENLESLFNGNAKIEDIITQDFIKELEKLLDEKDTK